MQTEVDENAAFISSLVSDLVTEKNSKCKVVQKYEDRALEVKGKVKGLVHEERKVLAEKQSKEGKKRRQKKTNTQSGVVRITLSK